MRAMARHAPEEGREPEKRPLEKTQQLLGDTMHALSESIGSLKGDELREAMEVAGLLTSARGKLATLARQIERGDAAPSPGPTTPGHD